MTWKIIFSTDKSKVVSIILRNLKSVNLDDGVLDRYMSEFHVEGSL